ncbi:MAG: hybrid sensor histidine kinase/response regulator [Candidatus Neomarinimicrobiota bacterium]|nr:MAG: hybrid sensor histidine kinase/response regulator [Candidatus Neomarinimicrobiota bacterium]
MEEEKEKLQIQLARVQKLEAIGRPAGGIAHDFNNMLTIIMGDTELVLNSLPSDSSARKYIKQIYETAMRSSDLVKQLLGFARKQVIKPEVVNLNRVIEPTIKLLSEIIGENIELVWIPGEDLYDIKVDPVQVDQILTNLCTNARDAISPGVGKIVIETKNVKLDESYCRIHAACIPGNYVMISVTDNGRGMDRETLKHIFEPFYTTKEVGKGTGLGLSTVYGIVKQNNGYIDAYSELGKGTTIKIYIPQYKSKEEISKEAVKVNQQIRERDLYGNETILMVEDEINILEMGKTILEKFGYKVLTAISPLEALEIVKEHGDSIELLITDLIMPGMNGRQLADSVAKLYPGIKVIYTSGYTPNVIMQSGVIRDNINFIQKPYSIHDLLLKVREVLNVKK